VVTTRSSIYSPITLHGRRVIVLRTMNELGLRGVGTRSGFVVTIGSGEVGTAFGARVVTWPRTSEVLSAAAPFGSASARLGTGVRLRDLFRDGRFVGEITLSSIQRGPLQSAFIGYWIDEAVAGQGLMPEAVVTMLLQYSFESLKPTPRGGQHHPAQRSRRDEWSRNWVIRSEGVAERYLEIDGAWEDHARYAITAEEWGDRAPELIANWLLPRRD
jgi:hypothetical protein